ncbi:MOSC domain-containing protein [Deinococcus wulumuqiensis]|uniref:MOSC domain-containing protein n=1 Tax=Deinococcus wulumuqiensis TaxID=980427 RepID=UPI00242CD9AF|nr:MOSC domain-containing protein [Deinococcus wulumuqiensis]
MSHLPLIGTVEAVSSDDAHRFSKVTRDQIRLLAGLGVEGDAHAGIRVQHRSRVKQDPTQPNLRQVHLIHSELLAELADQGFAIDPAALGENVLTRGLNLLDLPRGTRLHLGETAVVEVTGLRNPCAQIENFQTGLLSAVLDQDAEGHLIRKAGIMSIVLHSGEVNPGDLIHVELPPQPHEKLERV